MGRIEAAREIVAKSRGGGKFTECGFLYTKQVLRKAVKLPSLGISKDWLDDKYDLTFN